jgi:uncharacterized phage infection (PIP) family protein YhgE
MEEIVDSVKRVTDIMSEIMAATQEQTAGIEQINQAITQMDQVTQQNASLVEEAAAASEAMQEQAGTLAQAVSVFKLEDRQSAPTARTHAKVRAVAKPIARKPAKAEVAITASHPKRISHAAPSAGGEWEQF